MKYQTKTQNPICGREESSGESAEPSLRFSEASIDDEIHQIFSTAFDVVIAVSMIAARAA